MIAVGAKQVACGPLPVKQDRYRAQRGKFRISNDVIVRFGMISSFSAPDLRSSPTQAVVKDDLSFESKHESRPTKHNVWIATFDTTSRIDRHNIARLAGACLRTIRYLSEFVSGPFLSKLVLPNTILPESVLSSSATSNSVKPYDFLSCALFSKRTANRRFGQTKSTPHAARCRGPSFAAAQFSAAPCSATP